MQKKFKRLIIMATIAISVAMSMTSCRELFDILDGPPPPPHDHPHGGPHGPR
jgi:hypothetical protein